MTKVGHNDFLRVHQGSTFKVQSQAVVGGDGAGNRGGFNELRSCTNDGTYFHCHK
jgi:hypothetical protein